MRMRVRYSQDCDTVADSKVIINECRDELTTSMSSSADGTSDAIDTVEGESLPYVHTVKKLTINSHLKFLRSCNFKKF